MGDTVVVEFGGHVGEVDLGAQRYRFSLRCTGFRDLRQRRGANASISSRNISDGTESWTRRNNSPTVFRAADPLVHQLRACDGPHAQLPGAG